MPGSTMRPFASPARQGISANGPYGDSIEEMDWSTGQILAELKACGIAKRTMVLTTSGHGPISNDPVQGSVGRLKGEGYTTSERAMRLLCVIRWSDRIPVGSECCLPL